MGRAKAPPAPWDWIAQAREDAGISKTRMARLLDIQDRAYRRWEREPGAEPKLEHFMRFCEITGADWRTGAELVYGVTIPGLLNSPFDVLEPVA